MPYFWQLAINPKLKTQNSIIFFWYVDSYAKIFLILYPPLENSTTRVAILNSVLPPPREQNFCLIWGSSRTLVELLPKEGDSFQACKLGNLTLNYDQLSHAPTFANLPFLPRLHQPIFHFPLSTTAKTLFVMKCEYRTLTYLDK